MIVDFSAERQLLEAGKSAELVAAFRCIEEAEADGQPRFAPAAVRELGRIVTCRTYGPVVHELAHLAAAALVVDPKGGYERLFWASGPARPARFAAFFAGRNLGDGRPGGRVARTDNGIAVSYVDGSFGVAFGRMPVLAALIEFLVPAIGYAELDRALRPLGRPEATKKAVSEAANALSRMIYDYLKAHLPSAQTQRKFQALTGFLEGRRGDGFTGDALADEDALAFWLDDGAHGQADFKTYLAVHKAFAALVRALAHAGGRASVEGARAIGTDRAAGEVEPDHLRSLADAIEQDERNPLDDLAEPPAALIKFLNATERRALALLAETGRIARRLPLSQLRAELLAPVQDRMVEAQRRRSALAAETALDGASYAGECERVRGLAAHVRRMMLAALHVLSPGGAGARDGAPAGMLAAGAGVVDDKEDGAEEARRAYRGFSREGFGREAEPEIAAGFAAAAAPLAALSGLIGGFLDAVDSAARGHGGLDPLFARDRPVFAERLQALHSGGTQGSAG